MDTCKRQCKNCGEDFEIKIATKGKRKGCPIKRDENKIFCSLTCLNDWQRNISWEERIGIERASEIRKERSEQVSGDKNPSKDPNVARKISESLKVFLKENPRVGELNGFYNKNHTEHYKKWASESRKGKRSYNDEQYEKLKQNTPKKENHPNWLGGLSYGEYDSNFDTEMKDFIKCRDNFQCQLCGCKSPSQFHIHHIDYIKTHSLENNLILLCNVCHGKTNYNRDMWQSLFENKIKEKNSL